jgi:hypothetical protein
MHPLFDFGLVLVVYTTRHLEGAGPDLGMNGSVFERIRLELSFAREVPYSDCRIVTERGQNSAGSDLHGKAAGLGIDAIDG